LYQKILPVENFIENVYYNCAFFVFKMGEFFAGVFFYWICTVLAGIFLIGCYQANEKMGLPLASLFISLFLTSTHIINCK
jgi:hypothetical protein